MFTESGVKENLNNVEVFSYMLEMYKRFGSVAQLDIEYYCTRGCWFHNQFEWIINIICILFGTVHRMNNHVYIYNTN